MRYSTFAIAIGVVLSHATAGCADAHSLASDDDASLSPSIDGGASHDAAMPPTSCFVDDVPSGGFRVGEVAVITSPICAAEASCVVFHLEGDPRCVEGTSSCASCPSGTNACVTPSAIPSDPEGRSLQRVFCACHCSPGPDHAAPPFCTCGPDDVCMPDGDPGGGLCVPRALALGEGVCETDDQCGGGSNCDPTHHCT